MAGQAFASSLLRVAQPTKAAAQSMHELGIEFFDANGQFI